MESKELKLWIQNQIAKHQADKVGTVGTTSGYYDGKIEALNDVLERLNQGRDDG